MPRRSPLLPVVSRSALRRIGAGALAALLLLEPAAPAFAQNRGPIPYTVLNPRRPAAKPTPRPATTPAAPAPATPGTTTAAAVTPPKPAAPLAPPTLDPARLESYVDGLVTSAMADRHLAGVTVAVVQNGQVVLKKGYGVDRLSPRRAVDPDRTLFRLGSISKTFTWITVQKEIEAGHMRLDAPVNLYLPERLQLKDQGFKTPVRLRDLMTHTPGFESRVLGQLVERDWRRVRPLNLYLRQEQPRRVREPGQLVSYSNYGAGLAGAALANVQGKPFETLIEDEILGPAGLSNTTFREPRPNHPDLPAAMSPALADDVSQGFGWTAGAFAPRSFEYAGQIAPSGSASSTAADMARYMTLLLGGGTIDGRVIYSPVVDRALRTPLYRPGTGAAGWTAGFQDLPLPGGRRGFGHEGQTLSFSANMVLAPSLNLGVFVAANSEGGVPFVQNLPADIVREMYGPPATPPPSVADAMDAGVFAGRYLTTQRAYAGLEAFANRLTGRMRVTSQPDGALTVSLDGRERAWLPTTEAGVFRAADGDPAPLVIQRDGSGRARTLFAPWGGTAYQRQGPLDSLSLMAALAGLAALCALATVGGLFSRTITPMRQTLVQSRAALSQSLQAALWIIAFVAFAIWAAQAGDTLRLTYDWPGGLLVTASACALVAGILGVINVVLLAVVWRGGRRVDSWTVGRKLRFTLTSLIFVLFTALVGLWGGLTPWVS